MQDASPIHPAYGIGKFSPRQNWHAAGMPGLLARPGDWVPIVRLFFYGIEFRRQCEQHDAAQVIAQMDVVLRRLAPVGAMNAIR